jgi:hypothetical protein
MLNMRQGKERSFVLSRKKRRGCRVARFFVKLFFALEPVGCSWREEV